MTREFRRLIAPEDVGAVAGWIGARLRADWGFTRACDGAADALLIDAFDDADAGRALAVDDDRFEAVFVERTLDRIAALQHGMIRLTRPANILVIGSDAYLGRWDGVAQAAASAAIVGVVRSLAMEHAPAQWRVNMLALPLGTRPDDAALIADAAAQASVLLTTRSITGTTVLIDDGNNLKFRQARRR